METKKEVLEQLFLENSRLWESQLTTDSQILALKKDKRFAYLVGAHKIEVAYFMYCIANNHKLLKNGILEEDALVHLCAKTLFDRYISYFIIDPIMPFVGFDAKEFQDFLKELVEEHKILEIVEVKGKKYYLSIEKAKAYRLATKYKYIFMPYLLKKKEHKKAQKKPAMKMGLLFG